jgi:hypothetical protein
MGAERRRDPRIRCNLPCELRFGGRSLEGKVRNVSASGLGVAAEGLEVDQGDSITVTLRVDGLQFDVRALVWHVRSRGRGTAEKGAREFGLVLSDTSPEFASLVERLGTKQPQPTRSPRPPAAVAPVRPAASQPSVRGAISRTRSALKVARRKPALIREYRIRIKQNGGPRSCQIVASGVSLQAAVEAALREVGQGWIVLEAVVIP